MSLYYPLIWPNGRQRTEAPDRRQLPSPRFFSAVQAELERRLERMGAKRVMITSNLPLREGGKAARNVTIMGESPAVAVWFAWRGVFMAVTSDRFRDIGSNLADVEKIVDHLRDLDRTVGLPMMRTILGAFRAETPESQAAPLAATRASVNQF